MSPETAVPAALIGVPVDLDGREREIDDNDALERSMAAFADGVLSEDDYQQPAQSPPEAVLVDAPELPPEPEPAGPVCELLLDQQQAEKLLDTMTDGEWRRWGRPPMLRASGRGWYMSAWSEFDLREWVRQRTYKSCVTP